MTNDKKKSKFAASGTDQEKADRFKAGGQIAMLSFLVGGVFQAAWMSVMPRILKPEGMGLYGPMIGWFYVLASVIALGLPQTIVTFVSTHFETDYEESKKFMCDGNKLTLIISLTVFLLTVIGGGILRAVGVIDTITYLMAVALIFSCLAAISFWDINGILNGLQRLDLTSVGNLVFPLGQFAGAVGLAVLAGRFFDGNIRWMVVGAVAGLGIGQLTGFIAAAIIVRKSNIATFSELYALNHNNGLYKKILKFGGIAAVAMVANAVVQQFTAPLVRMVGINWHLFTDKEIGFFSTALLVAMVPMLLTGVSMALIPAMAEADGQGRDDLKQEYYTSAMQQCFSILGIIIVVFSLLVGLVIRLMNGPLYPAAVMGPLAFHMVFGGAGVALIFVLSNMFVGLKRPAIPAVITVLVLIGQIGCIFFFGLTFKKIEWAPAGFVIPAVLGCIAMLAIAHKIGLRFPWWTLLEPVACAVPAYLIVRFLLPTPPDNLANGKDALIFALDLAALVLIYEVPMIILGKRHKKAAPEAAAQAAK